VEHVDVIVVGAGIVGLAQALAAAKRGARVTIVERTSRAVGASVRNFGMIWPIGQPPGPLLHRALESRRIWLECAEAAPFWHEPCGALHVATEPDEWRVMEEFAARYADSGYNLALLTPDEAARFNPAVRRDRARGALLTRNELVVEPREAIRLLPDYLARRFGVDVQCERHARSISNDVVEFAEGPCLRAHRIIVCSGPDLRTLFPAELREASLVHCKLQMLRTAPQPGGWRMNTHLAGGLTLIHYKAFGACESLPALRARFLDQYPAHLRMGVHVLVSQNRAGQLTIGDSHEYLADPEPFDLESTNELILSYLASFANIPSFDIAERWHGIYPKSTRGDSELVRRIRPGVFVVNGLGGNGMTLSFGLAEDTIDDILADRDWIPNRAMSSVS
jgi:D-hydroxyproline dehydrogenase subunit beta